MAKMTEVELCAQVDQWISDARQFDQTDLSAHRTWAIKFNDGEVDIEPQPGRSKVVSHDLADCMGWILPGLLRVFNASERIAIYEPLTPEDEEAAKQATDGINFIFLKECPGYQIMLNAMHDGLLHGNGPIKLWWEGKPEYKTETLRGLIEDEYLAVISEPDVEVIEVTEYQEEAESPNEKDPYESDEAESGIDDAE